MITARNFYDSLSVDEKKQLFKWLVEESSFNAKVAPGRVVPCSGEQFITFVKRVRDTYGWGLKEAKDYADTFNDWTNYGNINIPRAWGGS